MPSISRSKRLLLVSLLSAAIVLSTSFITSSINDKRSQLLIDFSSQKIEVQVNELEFEKQMESIYSIQNRFYSLIHKTFKIIQILKSRF